MYDGFRKVVWIWVEGVCFSIAECPLMISFKSQICQAAGLSFLARERAALVVYENVRELI